MADWVEASCRCGCTCWSASGSGSEIIDEPLPDDPALYATTTIMHYAKGVAHAATRRRRRRRSASASVFARGVRAACRRAATCSTTSAGTSWAWPSAMLDGEIEYRRGHHDEAFAHLRRAVERDDGLPYDEPWGWMQPARHALGALLLEQGQVEEAAAVYRADLGLDDTLRPGLPASRQRLEPARVARVPAPPGSLRRGRRRSGRSWMRPSPRPACRSPRRASAVSSDRNLTRAGRA